jgi:hydroxymethylpyrimidine/phosphomethylpyrimidine kinase
MKPVALTIAGSDPSGGAGIQADLKTFHQFGVYGEAVITLLTVQNTVAVTRVEVLDPELVTAQATAVIEDIRPQSAKTGALGNAAVVRAVAELMRRFRLPLVVDPVIISKHGAPLMKEDGARAFRAELLPLALLVTPNLYEASVLSGIEVSSLADMKEAAKRIHGLGPRAVLVKGGHLAGEAVDVLYDGSDWTQFEAQRIATPHTHGTGCTYSAAITACLARGMTLSESVGCAKAFITRAIREHPGLGRGAGPVNHHAAAN